MKTILILLLLSFLSPGTYNTRQSKIFYSDGIATSNGWDSLAFGFTARKITVLHDDPAQDSELLITFKSGIPKPSETVRLRNRFGNECIVFNQSCRFIRLSSNSAASYRIIAE